MYFNNRFNHIYLSALGLLFAPGLLLVLSPSAALCQTRADSISLPTILESYFNIEDEQSPFSEAELALLQDLLSHPVHLLTGTLQDFQQIPFINSLQAAAIIQLRQQKQKAGLPFYLTDLQSIDGFSPTLLRLLGYFLDDSTARQPKSKRLTLTFLQGISRQRELKAGFDKPFDEGGFAGSPLQIFNRLNLSIGPSVVLKTSMEKDAGEAFSWSPHTQTYGFDHIAGSLQVKTRSFLRSVIVGDYSVSAGQGLQIWRSSGISKGSQPTHTPIKRGAGIRSQASREENLFLRGLALNLAFSNVLQAQLYHSHRTLDGSLQSATDARDDSTLFISSFPITGQHRTANELQRKDAVTEQLSGGIITVGTPNWQLGVSAYASTYNFGLLPDSKPAAYYANTDKSLQNVALNGSGSLTIGKAYVQGFGEFAISSTGGKAGIAGLKYSPARGFETLLLYRNYASTYLTRHGNAFSEQSKPQNEEGLYVGLEAYLTPSWKAGFFADFYRTHWLKSNAVFPSKGVDMYANLRYSYRKWASLFVAYRFKHKEEPATLLSENNHLVYGLESAFQHSLRLDGTYHFSEKLYIKTRLDIKMSHEEETKKWGTFLIQDIFWSPSSSTKFQLRSVLYDSDGGNATLYAYENDLKYRFTIRSYTGNGAQYFIIYKQRAGTHCIIEIKYIVTHLSGKTKKGSGIDSIYTSRTSNFHAQLILRF